MKLKHSKVQVAVIVIPTFNEAGSIGKMIDYLNTKTFVDVKNKKINKQNWNMKILIVDDNSPDGTGKIVEKKTREYKNVFLLSRAGKNGIGTAYLDGFKYAMEKLEADFVFEFDGDFQHPPECIPLMLKEMENGYDYVIGSRKIKGGSNPRGWGFQRVFFSEVGGLVARFILFFPFKNFLKVTDPTTGLKVTRVKGFIDKLNLNHDHLYTKSFGYKFQLLFETLKLGAKFKEIPLEFHVRNADESKIEASATIKMLIAAFKIRWFDDWTQRFLKFGLVGGFGFIINFFGLKFFNGVYKNIPLEIGLINFLANATASEISIISNFIFNNIWTFSEDKITSPKQLVPKFLTFNASSIVGGIIIPSFIIGLGTQIFGDQYRQLLLVIAVFGLTIPYNWFVYNKVIWKKKK